jgi:hypothetical protein
MSFVGNDVQGKKLAVRDRTEDGALTSYFGQTSQSVRAAVHAG